MRWWTFRVRLTSRLMTYKPLFGECGTVQLAAERPAMSNPWVGCRKLMKRRENWIYAWKFPTRRALPMLAAGGPLRGGRFPQKIGWFAAMARLTLQSSSLDPKSLSSSTTPWTIWQAFALPISTWSTGTRYECRLPRFTCIIRRLDSLIPPNPRANKRQENMNMEFVSTLQIHKLGGTRYQRDMLTNWKSFLKLNITLLLASKDINELARLHSKKRKASQACWNPIHVRQRSWVGKH